MLATVINGLALQSILESNGMYTRLMTAIPIDKIAEPYIRRRAISHLSKGRVIIFSAGTGTHISQLTLAALRASEIGADVILKGTRVDGIYSADPEKDSTATKFDKISFEQVIKSGLSIMDMTAFTMCNENNMPIIVFDIAKPNNLKSILEGEKNWYIS